MTCSKLTISNLPRGSLKRVTTFRMKKQDNYESELWSSRMNASTKMTSAHAYVSTNTTFENSLFNLYVINIYSLSSINEIQLYNCRTK